ncbi:MAG: hypothetical protein Ct9H300mP6_13350 [Gammaproteobacteria bacterium]|nr:MAG: hypothetical protein Ct9H300mP6_13350 [Gammaproteobacteria bacterium]
MGALINWVTLNSDVIVKGDAVNLDPETQAPFNGRNSGKTQINWSMGSRRPVIIDC